jgi:hypothetical protein
MSGTPGCGKASPIRPSGTFPRARGKDRTGGLAAESFSRAWGKDRAGSFATESFPRLAGEGADRRMGEARRSPAR